MEVGEVGDIRPGEAGKGHAVRLRGVEGLRALAAGTVLLHHIYLFGRAEGTPPVPLPGPGEALAENMRFGLTLFFVLSGFLLYRSYAKAILTGASPPRPGAFLRNRVLRILPAYWVVLLLVSLPLGAAIASYSAGLGRLTDPAALTANLLLVQGYSSDTALTGIGPAWSLSVEAVFYLSLPVFGALAVLLARRFDSARGRLGAVLAPVGILLLIGAAAKLALAFASPESPVWRLSFPAHADLFAVGMVAAVLHEGARERVPSARACLVAAAMLAVVVQVLVPAGGGRVAGGWDLMAAVTSGLVVLAVCTSRRGAGSRLLSVLDWRPVFWLGLVSYSVYLWHTPVILFLRDHGFVAGGHGSLVALTALILAVTLALSAITYRWIERPALRRQLRPRPEGIRPHPQDHHVGGRRRHRSWYRPSLPRGGSVARE